MASIFISYRRHGQSPGYAQAIVDRLKEHFGEEELFRDIDDIESGADFVEVLGSAVGGCKALLAVIGPDWLAVKDKAGRRRLDDPNDFVRVELASALERDVRVIPVLVGGAEMPSQDELPDDLKALARRHAHELSEKRWDYDIQQLISVLERAGVPGRAGRVRRRAERRFPKWAASAGIIALLGLGLILGPKVVEWVRDSDGSDDEINQQQAFGSLLIRSQPPGAMVLLNDQGRGVTSEAGLLVEDLPPGEHHIVVAMDGYFHYDESVSVHAGEETAVFATLEPVPEGRPPVEELIRQYRELVEGLAPLRRTALEGMLERSDDPDRLRRVYEYYRYLEENVIGERNFDFERNRELDGSLPQLLESQAGVMRQLDPDRVDEINRFLELQFALLLPREN